MEAQEHRRLTASERAHALSRALTEAARRARFSSRSKRALGVSGYSARRGQRLFRLFVIVSFLALVAAPGLAAALYYGVWASDQFVSEAQFTVMGGEVKANDSLGGVTGIPALAIVQDTQIVANYIETRAALEKVDADINLRNAYGRSDIDAISRAPMNASIERLLREWRRMTEVSIKMPSGIIVFHARAFSPEDAVAIARSVIAAGEDLINQLNARMVQDTLRNTDHEMQRAADRLSQARANLEAARNDEGMLDTGKASEALTKLITDARGSLLTLQQEYTAQSRWVNAQSPQMMMLKSRIDAAKAQIAELEVQMTTRSSDVKALSAAMTRFATLTLEHQIAERLYASSAAAAEIARIASERKMMYLNTFVQPTLPQEARYPKRALTVTLVVLGALALWGASCGLVSMIRNHMA